MVVGRSAEVNRGIELLARLGDGPAALLIEGDPGIGKSSVLDAIVGHARDAGHRVLRCRPSESEVRVAHSGLVELLGGLDPTIADALADAQRRPLRVALRWDEPQGPPIERMAIAMALASVFRALAAEGPLVVVVDDLQWLDDSTASSLEVALRHMDGLPVALLAAARIREGGWPRPAQRSFAPERFERFRMGALDSTSLRQIVTNRLGVTLTRRQAEQLTKVTGGNPLLALELAQSVGSSDLNLGGRPLPAPDDVRQLIHSRLQDLPDPTRAALLEAAAASSDHVGDPSALAPAERAGIVHLDEQARVAFLHPLYRSAVYHAAPLEERRRTHARLAAVEHDLEHRGRHLALATGGPDQAAADALDRASSAAAARGGYHDALDLAESALAATSPDDRSAWSERVVTAAWMALRAGEPRETIRIVDQALPRLTDDQRGPALLRRAEATVWAENIVMGAAAFELAIDALGEHHDLSAAAYLGLCFSRFQAGEPLPTVLDDAVAGLRAAERSGPEGAIAEALSVVAMVRWFLGEGVDRAGLDRARRMFDPDRPTPVYLRPDAIEATIVGYSDDIATALAVFGPLVHDSVSRGRLGDLPYTCIHAGILALWAARPDLIRELAAIVAQSRDDLDGAFGLTSVVILYQLYLTALQGDLNAARDLAAQGSTFAEESGSPYAATWVCGVMAQMELASGEPAAALQALEPLVPIASPDEPITDAGAIFFVIELVEALVALGQHDRAESVLTAFHSRSLELGRRWTTGSALRCRALLAAARGDLDSAGRDIAESVALLDGSGYVVEHARSLLALGQIERRRRHRAAAHTALQAALELFEQTELRLWIERARTELKRSWQPGTVASGLTASEQQIVDLVGSGLTNGEIAAAVFVSRRTVEATLSRVYRKVGVRNRAELISATSGARDAAPNR